MSYLEQFLALQPSGIALPTDINSNWVRLLDAFSETFQRTESRSLVLVQESDPRTSNELLEDWERVCGLPDVCLFQSTNNSLQVRRAAIVNVLNRFGGQTPEFFRKLAEICGLEIDIKEFRPFISGLSACGEVLEGEENIRFIWQVIVKGQRITWFRNGESECGDFLTNFDNAKEFECLLRSTAPYHTELLLGVTD